jgi:hypothetical protein
MVVNFAMLPELLRRDGADKRGVTRSQPLVREAFVRRFDDATRRRFRYRPGKTEAFGRTPTRNVA